MVIRVRSSKIVPPQLPAIVHRPRLQRFIQKNRHKRLILIQGQAAQGKSTLAALCVQILHGMAGYFKTGSLSGH